MNNLQNTKAVIEGTIASANINTMMVIHVRANKAVANRGNLAKVCLGGIPHFVVATAPNTIEQHGYHSINELVGKRCIIESSEIGDSVAIENVSGAIGKTTLWSRNQTMAS